jgi:hypothetical protein
MSDKPGKPRWDVRAHLHDPKYNETYRKINLLATLTWDLTHQQVYVDLTLKGLLEEILVGGTIDDAYDSGYTICKNKGQLKKFKKAVYELAQRPEAEDCNLRHFCCEDCHAFEENAGTLYDLFKAMREAGLDLKFFERFNPKSLNLDEQTEEAQEIDEEYLSDSAASKTIADYYSKSE